MRFHRTRGNTREKERRLGRIVALVEKIARAWVSGVSPGTTTFTATATGNDPDGDPYAPASCDIKVNVEEAPWISKELAPAAGNTAWNLPAVGPGRWIFNLAAYPQNLTQYQYATILRGFAIDGNIANKTRLVDMTGANMYVTDSNTANQRTQVVGIIENVSTCWDMTASRFANDNITGNRQGLIQIWLDTTMCEVDTLKSKTFSSTLIFSALLGSSSAVKLSVTFNFDFN